MGHHHHYHHHHHHHTSSSRGPYTYSEEPVTQQQKRSWKTRGIVWAVIAGIIVVASIALIIIFSVIESNMESGVPFIAMPLFAGVPLAFAIPNLQQGCTSKPQVTQVYDYGSYVRKKVARITTVKCPKCSAENEFGSESCTECGETLSQRCPHCGAEIITNDESCRDCGLALK